MSSIPWKTGDEWVQYNPPAHHPSREEWLKQKAKEKENEKSGTQD
jgi:hypothetical protein